jgi:hypothetical protein
MKNTYKGLSTILIVLNMAACSTYIPKVRTNLNEMVKSGISVECATAKSNLDQAERNVLFACMIKGYDYGDAEKIIKFNCRKAGQLYDDAKVLESAVCEN